MVNKGKKLKRYRVHVRGVKRHYGQTLNFSKANAMKEAKKYFGSKAYVKQIKY